MWPFGKRKVPQQALDQPRCVHCEGVLTHTGADGELWTFWSDEDASRPGWCHRCVHHDVERKRARRKRQEELAALVVGRLAAQQRGYRGELPEPTFLAAEAMRLAAAIIDSPEE